MKSITPVISVILLILITIVASVTAFFFVNTIGNNLLSQSGNQASQTTGYCSRIRLLSMDADRIRVQNNGCGSISDVVVFINGEPTNFNLDFPIGEGEIGEILLSNLDIGYYEIIIMLDNGLTQKMSYNSTQRSTNYTFTYPISYFAGQNSLLVDINEPNITYIRLPSNADINSLSLTINTPEVFSDSAVDFDLSFSDVLGYGYEGDDLLFFHNVNDSDDYLSINASQFSFVGNDVEFIGSYNFLNFSSDYGGDDKGTVTYKNGFIQGLQKITSSSFLYFNYSSSTHDLLNATINSNNYDYISLIVDDDNDKYFFYTNSTDYLFVSSTSNGGFFDLGTNSLVLDMPLLKGENSYFFNYDSEHEILRAIVTRNYNASEDDDESFRDIVYLESEDGITWSEPEVIISMYKYDYSTLPLSNFYLASNSAGDLLFILSESLIGGTDTFMYKKTFGGSWQKVNQINNCINKFFYHNLISDGNTLNFFCLPVKGIMSFETFNYYYESSNFGSSWTGPFKGYYSFNEDESPLLFMGRLNDEGKIFGLSVDMNVGLAFSSGFSLVPGTFGYREEGSPYVSLRVGETQVLSNYSLSSRSYSVNIKDYVDSYLSGCSHSCDIPIYLDSNSSMNISLSLSGNYQLPDFQMYSLTSGITKQSYSNSLSSQDLFFTVLKNDSIAGVSAFFDFKDSMISTEYLGINSRLDVKTMPIYGNKELFVISSSIRHGNLFDLMISKSTDLGETWTGYESVINGSSFSTGLNLPYNPMVLKNNYLHGFVNRTVYFNYSLDSKVLLTQDFSDVFTQDIYYSNLTNDLYIVYINLSNDNLYFAKNNDYSNAVSINETLEVSYSSLYDNYLGAGSIIENENGIHILIDGAHSGVNDLYYLNSSDNGASWSTTFFHSFTFSGNILPLNFLMNGNNAFVYWNIGSDNPYYNYIRFIDGEWGDVISVSGYSNFVADNNGSKIYAGINSAERTVFIPKYTYGFMTVSNDFGLTWSTPTYAFKDYNTKTLAAFPKFFFDMPYIYGFYYNYNPFPSEPINYINKFSELQSINPKLSISTDIVWQASGAQSGLINISGFSSTINDYSDSCIGESCEIPLIFNSSTNNNFELSYFGLTTESTKCSISNPCDDNNVCTYNDCIDNACQFLPIPESNVTGCALSVGCFNEYKGEYGVSCRCLNGRCRDSCGDNVCQAWESAFLCSEDCLGFFPEQIIKLDLVDEMSGENANYGLCAMDFTGDGKLEIVAVKKGVNSYNLSIYNYTNNELVFEREKLIPHSGEVMPYMDCGNLSNPEGLKVVVVGSVDESAFIDIINITTDSINVENSSEFYLLNSSGFELSDAGIYSLVIGDLDGGDNEIYFKGRGYYGSTRYSLLYRYNYTDNNIILDDKIDIESNFVGGEMIISRFNDSKASNELIFSTYNSNYNNLKFYSYENGLILDNSVQVSSLLPATISRTSITSIDVTGDSYDEIFVLYDSSATPYMSTLKVYSINSGVLSILDSDEIFIDSKDTFSVVLASDNFDSTPDTEIVAFLLTGNCPQGIDSYFRVYNFTSGQLNLKNQRKINDIEGLKIGNIASYFLSNFKSADLNDDGISDLLLNGFLSNYPCSLYADYYNSFVFYQYRDE
ncbi:MAG: sialidase family protein [Candidatus Nanoarchaeia archaeon]